MEEGHSMEKEHSREVCCWRSMEAARRAEENTHADQNVCID